MRHILYCRSVSLARCGLLGQLLPQLDNFSFHFRISGPLANALEVLLNLAGEVESPTSGADGERILDDVAPELVGLSQPMYTLGHVIL